MIKVQFGEALRGLKVTVNDSNFVFGETIGEYFREDLARLRVKFGEVDHHAISGRKCCHGRFEREGDRKIQGAENADDRSEEHTSELQSLMRISYAVFCL